ncbi:uncharacterized protein LOC129598700 [Paramacrobiotus metropolitanus]|uniref:uncharacterized protein LOC129598700 n=1 Tax=Paramacrobiotus metropolitanus TaxID=2943436 RepID=UPI00244602CF|nr:uncharacterized protein LOC129598700 [Paramacrobiotus metropolitanus]
MSASRGVGYGSAVLNFAVVLPVLTVTVAAFGSQKFMDDVQNQIQQSLDTNLKAAQKNFATHQDKIDKLHESISKMSDTSSYGTAQPSSVYVDNDGYSQRVFVSGSASVASDGQESFVKATGYSSRGPCTVTKKESGGSTSAEVHCKGASNVKSEL